MNITSNFITMDQVWAMTGEHESLDRRGYSAALSREPYTSCTHNNLLDGADVAFQTSADGGVTFSHLSS